MKHAFIIAIVAVAMIGVMVPSVFAEHIKITIVTVDESGFSPACADAGCYVPLVAIVDVGGVVTMTNTDPTGVHTFTSGTVDGFAPSPDGIFDTSVLMSGDSFEWKPQTDTDQPYYCMLHTWMIGTIIVGDVDEEHADNHGDNVEKVPISSQISGIINLEKNTFSLSKYSTTMTTISGIIDSDSRANVELNISKNNEIILQQKTKLTNSGKFSLPIILDEKFTPGSYTITGIFENNVFDEVNFKILDDSSKNEEYAVMDKPENTVKDTSKNITGHSKFDHYENMDIIISDVKIVEQEYRDFISYTVTMRDSNLKVHEDYQILPKVIRTFIDYGEGGGFSFGNDPKTFSGWEQEGEEGCEWADDYHYLSGADGGIYSFNMCHYVEKGYDEFLIILDYSKAIRDYPGDTILDRSRIIEQISKEEGIFGTSIRQSPVEESKKDQDDILKQEIQTEEKSSEGGGCLIATATYGSEMSQQVQQLRELRDNQLLQTVSGTQFMNTFNDVYYSFSPIIADYERENLYFKEAVKLAIAPMIGSLSLMENANSESEVLGLGLSVIMLNLGMYLGVPAMIVIGIKKRN